MSLFFKLEKMKHRKLRQLPVLLEREHDFSWGVEFLAGDLEGTLPPASLVQ